MEAKSEPAPIKKNSGTLKVTTPSDREVAMTRVFDAPRRLVFKAWTTPELMKRWLYGPEEWKLAVCEFELRVGGKVRFEWRDREGKGMGLSGVCREVATCQMSYRRNTFNTRPESRRLEWRGAEEDFLGYVHRVGTDRGHGVAIVVGTGGYDSDWDCELVVCVSQRLVLASNFGKCFYRRQRCSSIGWDLFFD
jgi:hypothetical protein